MDWWYKPGEVVQFIEEHKWAGCFGVINEVTEYNGATRYLIAIPTPSGVIFVYSNAADHEFEYVGKALLTIK